MPTSTSSRALLALALVLSACNASRGTSSALLCHSCQSDADCNGNPCYADTTGSRFCGAPCTSCPSGFSCQPVLGTAGTVVQSCFPDSEMCLGSTTSNDQGVSSNDFAGQLVDLSINPSTDQAVSCAIPTGGTIGPTGGTVDRLFFGYTGDTRPTTSGASYPAALQTVANNIFTQMAQKGVQFGLDGGDHMEPSGASGATTQMGNYATAVSHLGKQMFMTMGNHECETQFDAQDCSYAGAQTSDYRFSAFMAQLSSISGQTSPYYRFDIQTNAGKAAFIVIADDAWDTTQQTWLTQQLTDADKNATYTFVSKHHPDGNTDQPAFQQIYDLVTSHKYTLFLTGHSHEYKHQPSDHRAVVMGLGGAPFDNPNQMWWGYLTVMQCTDNHIYVTVYDQATGTAQDSFNVPPQ